MALGQKIIDGVGLRAAKIIAVVLISVVIAGAVLMYEWLGIAMAIIGIGFVAFIFVAPLQALLFWMVAAPLADFYLRIPMGQGIPDVTFTRITVVTLFFVMLLQVALNMRELLPLGKTEKGLVIFTFFAVASMLLRDNLTENMQTFLDGYATPFAIFFLAKNLIKEKDSVRLYLYALCVVGFYLSVIGIIQYFTEINLFAPKSLVIVHKDRAHGPFVNAVEYGGVLSIIFFGVLYLFSEFSPRKKLWTIPILILTVAAIFFSLTRAVWLALIIGLLLIVYYLPKYRKILALASAGALVVAISAWLLMPDSSSFQERASEVGPIYSRFALYATALNTVKNKPILGYGFGVFSFYNASRDNLVTFSFIGDQFGLNLRVPHNEFLHILVMLGVVGLSVYVFIFYSNFKKSRQLRRYSMKSGSYAEKLPIFYWAIFGVFIINSLLVDMMWFTYFNSLLFLTMGIIEGVCSDPAIKGASVE